MVKLRNFETGDSGDATEASAWVGSYISLRLYVPYIYNKVYAMFSLRI